MPMPGWARTWGTRRGRVVLVLAGAGFALAAAALLVGAGGQTVLEGNEEPPAQVVVAPFQRKTEQDSVLPALVQYSALHPVYNRCSKVAKMEAFADAITRSCGNVHELSSCAYTCTSEMWAWSEKMGCCFETVLAAYAAAAPEAEHAWRMWQGTMSGKCGVTFAQQSCGESVGEAGFSDLKAKIGQLEDVAEQNAYDISRVASDLYGNSGAPADAYDRYYHDTDDYGTDFYGDNYRYPDDSALVPPSYYARKGGGAQMMAHLEHGPSNGRRGLGDEVFDLGTRPGEDMGDVHVPAEKLQPYSYAHKKQHGRNGRPLLGDRYEPIRGRHAEKGKTQSLAQGTWGTQRRPKHLVRRARTQALNSYFDAEDFANSLHMKQALQAALSGVTPGADVTMPRFGEAWQGSALGDMPAGTAGIAPPTPGEAWQGKAMRTQKLSMTEPEGMMPAALPFEARVPPTEEETEKETEEQVAAEEAAAAAAEDDPRVSEEEGVAFPLARGVLIGGDGSIGIGRPAGKSSVSVHILC